MSPGRLADTFARFDLGKNPTMRPAYERCKAVADGREWCAFLSGSFGNGKTHLGIAALLSWYEQHKTGHFWKVPDFLAWLRRQVFDLGYPEEETLRPYREGMCLIVFDDLGTENPTDWSYQQLYRVLDSRYELRAPTIITSNVSGRALDGRILSRFRSGLVICEGKDLREIIT